MPPFICQRTVSKFGVLLAISLPMAIWAVGPPPVLPTPDQFFRSSLESEGAERVCSPAGVRLAPANLRDTNPDTQQALNWLQGWGAQHFRFKGPAGCTDWEFVLKCWQITIGLPVTGVMSEAEVKSLLAERDRTAMEYKAAYRQANGGKDVQERPSEQSLTATNVTPNKNDIREAVDSLLRRWSQGWMMDRYVSGSVTVLASRRVDDTAYAQGRFRFTRGMDAYDIPWSAQFDAQSRGWALNSLCYRDTTSHSSDCRGGGLTLDARSILIRIATEGLEPVMADLGTDAKWTLEIGQVTWRMPISQLLKSVPSGCTQERAGSDMVCEGRDIKILFYGVRVPAVKFRVNKEGKCEGYRLDASAQRSRIEAALTAKFGPPSYRPAGEVMLGSHRIMAPAKLIWTQTSWEILLDEEEGSIHAIGNL